MKKVKNYIRFITIFLVVFGIMPILSMPITVFGVSYWVYLEENIYGELINLHAAPNGQLRRDVGLAGALAGIQSNNLILTTNPSSYFAIATLREGLTGIARYDIAGMEFTMLSGRFGFVGSSPIHGQRNNLLVYGDSTRLGSFEINGLQEYFLGVPTGHRRVTSVEFSVLIPEGTREIEIRMPPSTGVGTALRVQVGIGDAFFFRGQIGQDGQIPQRINSGFPYLQIFSDVGTFDIPSGATLIHDSIGLAAISGSQGHYVLANDIRLSSTWIPIENFSGTLDGAGHVITGLNVLIVGENGQGAGLFGTIRDGNVTIRNLGVEGDVFARLSQEPTLSFDMGANLHLFAGGLIGRVSGGNVTIENSYFNGNVNVRVQQASLIRAIFSILPKPLDPLLELGYEIVDGVMSAIPENSRAYAGGLIGRVGSGASVTINNSFSRGRVFAYAETSPSIINTSSRSYAGGLVGKIAHGSYFTIGNNYTMVNVAAETWRNPGDFTGLFALPQHLYSGGLFGFGNSTTSIGTSFRDSSRTVIGNRLRINDAGTPLTRTQMREQLSFPSWDFDMVWAIDIGGFGGLPVAEEPTITFIEGFSSVRGSGEEIALTVDRDISIFDGVSVNEIPLTQNAHFTVSGGSTRITLLPSYLDTLAEGFHTLTVAFTDGVIVEEEFAVIETVECILSAVSNIYVDGQLVFSNGAILVDECFFEPLALTRYRMRIEFIDGHSIEELFGIERASATFHINRIVTSVGVLIIVVIGVSIALFIKKFRKYPTPNIGLKPNMPQPSKYCSRCGVALKSGGAFCKNCGYNASSSSIRKAPMYNLIPTLQSPTNQTRMPLIFLLETSTSTGAYIKQLNDSLNRFRSELCQDRQAQDILDVAVIQFGDDVNVLQNFAPIVDMKPTRLITSGRAYYTAPIQNAIEKIDTHVRNQPLHYKPWIILIAGSNPIDDISSVAVKLKALQENDKLRFMALGVQGSEIAALKKLTDIVFRLDGTDFTSFFDWICKCISAISKTSYGEKPQLPTLQGNIYRDK